MFRQQKKVARYTSVGRCIGLKILLALIGCVLLSGTAHGQYLGCQIGFLVGSTPHDNQGNLILADAAWNDASIIEAGSPCLGPLMDWLYTNNPNTPVESNLVNRQVTVYTKRDASNLYFRFVVQDSTTTEQDPWNPAPQLANGEKIVIELDPQNAGGSQLSNGGDYRLDIAHRWSTTPGTIVTTFYQSTNTTSICAQLTGKRDWQSIATPGDLQVALDIDAKTQYTLGVQIPFGDIGGAPNPNGIGVGFIVVNDLGYCDQAHQVCKATATSFPFDPVNLAITSATKTDAPTDPVGCSNWIVPSYWGGGPFNALSGGVTISRLPVAWLSQAITVKACGTTPNYQYYPDPCKLTIDATLDNSTGINQTRNILFLWGDFGTGQFHWRFVDLQENVTIPAAGKTVTSNLWSNVPQNLPEHPCVRVYILPATLLASFSKTDIETKFDTPGFTAADLETAYALGPPQWAQKNISVAPTNLGSTCPVCPVASLAPVGAQPSALTDFRTLQASISPRGYSGLFANVLGYIFDSQSNVAGRVSNLAQMPIYLSGKEREQFQEGNALVQVRAVCSAAPDPSNKKPRYEFLEDCGGLLKIVSLSLLQKNKNVPLTFSISNSAKVPRTFFLTVTPVFPPGVQPIPISIDTKPHLLQPGETHTIRGTVGRGGCFLFPGGMALPLLFTVGLLTLGLASYRRRVDVSSRP